MIIRKPIFISNIWVTYKHRCSQRFLCVGFILWLLHKTVATVVASFYRLFKYWVSIPRYASTRNNIQILHAYAFHHNSRNLFHINAIKQKLGFFLQLKKTSRFCSPCYVNICFSAYIYFLLFIKTHEDYIVSNRLPNHKRHKKWLVLRPIKYYCSAFLLYRHIYSLRKVMLMHSMQTDNFSFGSRSLKLYTEEAP